MGTIRTLWLQWKMLRLPWRKKFFVGQDLTGNTFWEFRDPLSKGRLRRIVHRSPYLPKSHYADVQITPQWHQWLRQTRIEAPTHDEQRADLVRQSQLKLNAQLADQRWESKARYIERPASQPQPMLKGDVRLDAEQEQQHNIPSESARSEMKTAVGGEVPQQQQRRQSQAPQAPPGPPKAQQAGGNPSADYQPESWTPGATKAGKKRI